ncbi:MAG: NAD(P)H-dependent oxidoreductase [Acidimicrobiia bacterium]|nr:NAD(P)H-dependent oxidoreductase [Acidimicrobiia bacterium]
MRTLIVYAHPHDGSFTADLRDRVAAGARRAGAEVQVLDLHDMAFDPVLSAEERALHHAPPTNKPWLADHFEALRWAEHIVWVYPTWWSGPPAILKGWVDRVWVEGVAYDLPEGATTIRPLLTNVRRMTVVTTHGSPRWVNVLEGHVGRAMILRGLRSLCGFGCKRKFLAAYGLDSADDAARRRFAERVERFFARVG